MALGPICPLGDGVDNGRHRCVCMNVRVLKCYMNVQRPSMLSVCYDPETEELWGRSCVAASSPELLLFTPGFPTSEQNPGSALVYAAQWRSTPSHLTLKEQNSRNDSGIAIRTKIDLLMNNSHGEYGATWQSLVSSILERHVSGVSLS